MAVTMEGCCTHVCRGAMLRPLPVSSILTSVPLIIESGIQRPLLHTTCAAFSSRCGSSIAAQPAWLLHCLILPANPSSHHGIALAMLLLHHLLIDADSGSQFRTSKLHSPRPGPANAVSRELCNALISQA